MKRFLLHFVPYLLITAIGTISICPAAYADDRAIKLRVAFIYNFLKYTEWPVATNRSADDPITVCLLSGSGLETYAKQLETRRIGERRIAVHTLQKSSLANSISACHLIYLGTDSDSALVQIPPALPVLVVGDDTGSSTINIATAGETIQFDVSIVDAKRRGLILSSQLLRIARKVTEE